MKQSQRLAIVSALAAAGLITSNIAFASTQVTRVQQKRTQQKTEFSESAGAARVERAHTATGK
jgi:hypothetical protein